MIFFISVQRKHETSCHVNAIFVETLGNMKKVNWDARAEAYAEAAEHLIMDWTDDKEEQREGEIVAKQLRKAAIACHNRKFKKLT